LEKNLAQNIKRAPVVGRGTFREKPREGIRKREKRWGAVKGGLVLTE